MVGMYLITPNLYHIGFLIKTVGNKHLCNIFKKLLPSCSTNIQFHKCQRIFKNLIKWMHVKFMNWELTSIKYDLTAISTR